MADKKLNVAYPEMGVMTESQNPIKEVESVDINSVLNNDAQNTIKDHIIANSKNDEAIVVIEVADKEFVDKLKEFISEKESEESSAKANIEATTSAISEGLKSDASIDKNDLQSAISSENILNSSADIAVPNIELDAEFVKNLTNTILNSLNLNNIVSTTVEQTVKVVKSLVDAGADKFKNALNDSMNKGFKFDKLARLNSEKGEDILGISSQNKNQNSDTQENETNAKQTSEIVESHEEEQETNSVYETVEQNYVTINEVAPPQEETEKVDKILEDKSIKNLDNKKEKQKQDNQDKVATELTDQQKALDDKRKKSLLEVDQNISEMNQALKKIITIQDDVVEDYDVRKSSGEDKKDSKQKSVKKDKEEKETSDWASTLMKGIGIAAIFSLLLIFKGYAAHKSLQDYIKKHAKDSSETIESELHDQITEGNKQLSDLQREKSSIEKRIKSDRKELEEYNEELESNDLVLPAASKADAFSQQVQPREMSKAERAEYERFNTVSNTAYAQFEQFRQTFRPTDALGQNGEINFKALEDQIATKKEVLEDHAQEFNEQVGSISQSLNASNEKIEASYKATNEIFSTLDGFAEAHTDFNKRTSSDIEDTQDNIQADIRGQDKNIYENRERLNRFQHEMRNNTVPKEVLDDSVDEAERAIRAAAAIDKELRTTDTEFEATLDGIDSDVKSIQNVETAEPEFNEKVITNITNQTIDETANALLDTNQIRQVEYDTTNLVNEIFAKIINEIDSAAIPQDDDIIYISKSDLFADIKKLSDVNRRLELIIRFNDENQQNIVQ